MARAAASGARKHSNRHSSGLPRSWQTVKKVIKHKDAQTGIVAARGATSSSCVTRRGNASAMASHRTQLKKCSEKVASGLPHSSETARRVIKRKHAQKGRVASSNATSSSCAAGNDGRGAQAKAASGAKRRKIRMPGLFGFRHWIYPEDQMAFSFKIGHLKSQFQGQAPSAKAIKTYQVAIQKMMVQEFHGGRTKDNGGRYVARLPPAAFDPNAASCLGAASPARGGTQSRQPAGTPASGGITSTDLETRLKIAFRPLEKVEMRKPCDAPAAAYIQEANAAVAYMQAKNATDSATDIQWLPQEAADWLYQATHYCIPLLQTLLGTHKAFNTKGQYLDANGEPASGGQLVAFWGTEMGSRRDRALIAYDTDVDFEAFVTPCCDFAKVWSAAAPLLESIDLICKVTTLGKYYRICPRFPLTSNSWREWCHEARQPGVGRKGVLEAAKVKKTKGYPPAQPIGPHFIDIGVKVVVPNTPVVIQQGAACGANRIIVEPHQLFPIVEGFFGPLRVPLPRTSAVLDAEYGDQWRTKYAVKTLGPKSGVGKYTRILDQHCRRAIHPSVPLKGCPTHLGCFEGASCDASPTDISWTWW